MIVQLATEFKGNIGVVKLDPSKELVAMVKSDVSVLAGNPQPNETSSCILTLELRCQLDEMINRVSIKWNLVVDRSDAFGESVLKFFEHWVPCHEIGDLVTAEYD
jgi:hypothetical protein